MLRNILLAVVFALLSLTLALSFAGATADGVNLHWSATGNGKKAVILVHGGMCDESFWSRQVPTLAQKYRVISLDLPGHGQSGSPEDGKFSMDLFARAVEAVRREEMPRADNGSSPWTIRSAMTSIARHLALPIALVPSLAVTHNARKFESFGDPAAIFLAVQVNRQIHFFIVLPQGNGRPIVS